MKKKKLMDTYMQELSVHSKDDAYAIYLAITLITFPSTKPTRSLKAIDLRENIIMLQIKRDLNDFKIY